MTEYKRPEKLDEKLKYEILKAMASGTVGHNTRDMIDHMVAQGWEEKMVVEHMVEMWRQKLFDLTPDPGIFFQ